MHGPCSLLRSHLDPPRDQDVNVEHLSLFDLGTFSLVSTLVLFVSTEVGFRYGRHRAHSDGPHNATLASTSVSTIEAALLGLLALLLGFAFAMAMNRYDARKQVVLDEASDVRTAFLRSALLPAPYREETRRLLLAYVDSRIAGARLETGLRERQAAHAASRRLQRDLWTVTVAAVRTDPNEVTTGYFSSSLTDVISDYNRRLTAIANHVPSVILLLLLAVAIIALFVTGASAGLRGVRLAILRLALSVLVAQILTVIIDLDRPGEGLIRVSVTNLIELRAELPAIDPSLARPEATQR